MLTLHVFPANNGDHLFLRGPQDWDISARFPFEEGKRHSGWNVDVTLTQDAGHCLPF